jgi:hypothetical protein
VAHQMLYARYLLLPTVVVALALTARRPQRIGNCSYRWLGAHASVHRKRMHAQPRRRDERWINTVRDCALARTHCCLIVMPRPG